MPVDILVGLQWGDEGKGKIVDILSPQYDIVARFQGGPNAGHTLVIEDQKFIFHTMPSGVIHQNVQNVLGSGMVVDPVTFKKEVKSLLDVNIDPTNRVFISKNASIITPMHKILDQYFEFVKGENKVGTTSRGIGPTYQDKIARVGLRFLDVLSGKFLEKYELLKQRHLHTISLDFDYDKNAFNEFEKEWFEAINYIKGFNIIDTEAFINQKLDEGANVLAEGAQGTLLDINFGTYPYVTSSNTISSGACIGLGISPFRINKIFGVFKAYTTRVGEGPFFTEEKSEIGDEIMKKGHEFGSTTGRPRRCGWLDLEALKYAIMLNGVTDLIITKSDVLTGIGKIKVSEHYKSVDGDILQFSDNEHKQIVPDYTQIDSWSEDISKMRTYDELPVDFKSYVTFIEKATNVNISMISVGPKRSEIILK